jgi:K(+)-stimulated pyrophosphate-energized sodium pump
MANFNNFRVANCGDPSLSNDTLCFLTEQDSDPWVELTSNRTSFVSMLGGCVTLVFALLFAYQVLNTNTPDPNKYKETLKISQQIAKGADAFLKAEYIRLLGFVLVVFFLIGGFVAWEAAGTFLWGAFLSAMSGYFGMKIATRANVRTCVACAQPDGLNKGLQVAFKSGSVMALCVVGSGLVGVTSMYLALDYKNDADEVWEHMSGFAFGASSIALFARVGGGIYTKAADVGADLVGKVEESLEEDSPDNPATIADNVGDNVGDVAGMGADLFESFVGSLIAAATIGVKQYGYAGIAFPLWVAGFGAGCSIVGSYFVRATQVEPLTAEEAEGLDEGMQAAKMSEKQLESLLGSMRNAIIGTMLLVVGTTFICVGCIFGTDSDIGWELFGCVLIGLVCGWLIGFFTEYATSYTYAPTQSIGQKTSTGPATVIIQGLGIGMLSTVPPVIFIVISIIATYSLSGTYGIAVSAVGMLSTLGVTLATDAYGPVADNAGGIAEMAPDEEIESVVRETTDALDALGNTTAATGKGFAIGSAVLTALALMNAFADATDQTEINLLDVVVLPGILIGALLPFVFAALTMLSVGKAAEAIMYECRDQLNKKWKSGTPLDSQKCVEISTAASLREMVVPGVLAVFCPLIVGVALGPKGLLGLLAGGISSGFMLAVTMANAGGAWDNAKKWIEKGNMGEGKGKKSSNHEAAVVGDTVGDPFKDTSGPALNILIKLMSIVSLTFAPALKDVNPPDEWWIALITAAVVAVGLALWINFAGQGINAEYEKIDAEAAARHAAGGVAGAEIGDVEMEEKKQ